MLYIYLPFNDPDLVHSAENFYDPDEPVPRPFTAGTKVRVRGAGTRQLASLRPDETLYIMAHGRESTGSDIAGIVAGHLWGTRIATMKATTLARYLDEEENLQKEFADIRLLVCWGGYTGGTTPWGSGRNRATLQRNQTEAPFAGQLCSALKGRGYYRMIVTGYTGEISMSSEHRLPNIGVDGPSGRLVAIEAFNRPLQPQRVGESLTINTATRTCWY